MNTDYIWYSTIHSVSNVRSTLGKRVFNINIYFVVCVILAAELFVISYIKYEFVVQLFLDWLSTTYFLTSRGISSTGSLGSTIVPSGSSTSWRPTTSEKMIGRVTTQLGRRILPTCTLEYEINF